MKKRQLGPDVVTDVQNNFQGRMFAFSAAQVDSNHWGLCVAEANIPGYTPISGTHFAVESYDEAMDEADRLNLYILDIDPATAGQIVCSSMAAGEVSNAEI